MPVNGKVYPNIFVVLSSILVKYFHIYIYRCIEVLPTGGASADPSNNVVVRVVNRSLDTRYAYITVNLHQYTVPHQESALKISDTAMVTSSLQELASGKKWVIKDFMPTQALAEASNGFLSYDSVMFKVCISEITCGKKRKETATTPEVAVGCGHNKLARSLMSDRTTLLPVERALATDLQNLLISSFVLSQNSPNFSDITVCSKEAGSTLFMHCHKAILAARSCVLSEKFTDPMFGVKYAISKGFRYPMDVKECCLNEFITFLYTDKIE